MKIKKGSTMVLNTIGKGGFEGGGTDWARKAGIKPDDLVVVCSNQNVRVVTFVEDGMKFGHPTCKFALVGGHDED